MGKMCKYKVYTFVHTVSKWAVLGQNKLQCGSDFILKAKSQAV